MKSILIKNFKSIKDFKFEINPVNILIGPNSAGKSSLIQALLVLKQSFEKTPNLKFLHLSGRLTNIGTAKDALCFDSEEDKIEFELINGNVKVGISYELSQSKTLDKNLIYNANILTERNGGLNTIVDSSFFEKSKFLYISSARRVYSMNASSSKDQDIGVLNGDTVFTIIEQNLITKVMIPGFIEKSGKSSFKDNYDFWINRVSPGTFINTIKYQNEDLISSFVDIRKPNSLPYDKLRLSNVGLGLNYLSIIVTGLLLAEPDSFIIIENPEIHLHPKAIQVICEMIEQCASCCKVIIETHSLEICKHDWKNDKSFIQVLPYNDRHHSKFTHLDDFDDLISNDFQIEFGVSIVELLRDNPEIIVFTEDQITTPIKSIIDSSNPNNKKIVFETYKTSSNYNSVINTLELIVSKFQPTDELKLIFHLDKDFKCREKERTQLDKKSKELGIKGHLFITEGYSIEAYFLDQNHLESKLKDHIDLFQLNNLFLKIKGKHEESIKERIDSFLRDKQVKYDDRPTKCKGIYQSKEFTAHICKPKVFLRELIKEIENEIELSKAEIEKLIITPSEFVSDLEIQKFIG